MCIICNIGVENFIIPEGTTELEIPKCGKLKELTKLPNSLLKLYMDGDGCIYQIRELPPLPPNLQELDVCDCYYLFKLPHYKY